MTSIAHTSRPWSVTGGGRTIMGGPNGRFMIAFVYDNYSAGEASAYYYDYPEPDEAKANSRLISVAPLMLEILKRIEEIVDDRFSTTDERWEMTLALINRLGRTAIGKAEDR